MATTAYNTTKLIEKGIKILRDNLGADNALRFMVEIERAKGDSVAQFQNMLKGKSVTTIHKHILAAKAKKRI